MTDSPKVALDDVAGWKSALDDALTSTGGELSAQERAWADSILDHGQQAGGEQAMPRDHPG